MRIVHLLIGGDVAGGQLVALRLARAARARGDDVSFVSPEVGPFVERLAEEGFAVFLADVSRTYRLPGAIRLARHLRAVRADVLHTHTHLAAGVIGRVAARAAGARVVAHLHIENYFRRQRLPAALLRSLDNRTARLCSRLVAVSENTRAAFVRQGYPAERLEVVHNGVDLEDDAARGRDGIRAELGIPDDAPLVGEIGRLCDVKGQRELIRAAARIPGLHVILVGKDLEAGGAFRRELERECARLGLVERVLIAGYRASDEVLDALDVFALPSWIEGLPLVVLEAMARGLPVVATRVGGTPELVVDGETGLLVPPRDDAALADALARLVADHEFSRRLGEAGRVRVAEHFSARAMEKRVLEVYDDVARAG